jgi:organic radical activating enzyme
MKVNEIFYSLQGEGCHSGTPAVFVRLSGCNLRCPFCDTRHEHGTEMSVAEVVEAVRQYPAHLVVVTGGEPALQLTPSLVDALHAAGRRVAVETNGTRPLPANVDWVTLSPKDAFLGPQAAPVLTKADELKLGIVFTQTGCMGYCHAEPTIEVKCPGKDPIVFGHVDNNRADEILTKYVMNNEMVEGVIPVNYETI